MKFLTDENIAKSVISFLRNKGHDICDLKEEGEYGLDDIKVLKWAAKERRILLSHDRDFIDLFSQFRGKATVLVIRLFRQTPKETKKFLEKFLLTVKEKEVLGKLVILEENNLRIIEG